MKRYSYQLIAIALLLLTLTARRHKEELQEQVETPKER